MHSVCLWSLLRDISIILIVVYFQLLLDHLHSVHCPSYHIDMTLAVNPNPCHVVVIYIIVLFSRVAKQKTTQVSNVLLSGYLQ